VSKNSGKVVIRANVETLPHHSTLIRAAPSAASTRVKNRHDEFSRQRRQREPPRHAAGGGDGEQPADHEHAIGDGSRILPTFETWCQRRATKPSIQSVAPERGEQPRREGAMIGAKEQPEEERAASASRMTVMAFGHVSHPASEASSHSRPKRITSDYATVMDYPGRRPARR
jgi:hypothetical protein